MSYRILFLTFLLPALAFSYTIVRKDGKPFSGELIRQTPQETILKGKDGVTLRFRADQIDWDKTTAVIRKEEANPSKETKVRELTFETKEVTPRKKWTGEPLTFDFKDIDIRDFFRFIADLGGFDLMIDPAVKGTLTMKLHEVPWDQALDLVCRTYGLGYEVDGKIMSVRK